jgi:hypothetical protein
MQLANTLYLTSVTALPAKGDTITNGGSTQGIVVNVDGFILIVTITAGVGFVVGDVIPNIGIVSDVYVQEVMDYKNTVISQYGNSPTLLALVQSAIDAINPYINLDNFYNDVWNIETARGWGLDVWGRIVGVSRIVQVQNLSGYDGFAEAGIGAQFPTFGFGKMYKGDTAGSGGLLLTDDAYRLLILFKAAANISDCSIPSLNAVLSQLFPSRGNLYVQTDYLMNMWIVLTFALQPYELSILTNSNAFPVPTGVNFGILPLGSYCQFAEAGIGPNYPTFGHGTLFGELL